MTEKSQPWTGFAASASTEAMSGSPQAAADIAILYDIEGLSQSKNYEQAPEDIKKQIASEHTYNLFASIRYNAFFTIPIATIAVFVLYRMVPATTLFTWFGVITVVTIARQLFCIRFIKVQPDDADFGWWLRILWGATLLLGLAWAGLLWVVWATREAGILAYVAFVLIATVMGGYTTVSNHPRFFYAVALPVFIALIALFSHAATGQPLLAVLSVIMSALGVCLASVKGLHFWRGTMVLLHQHHGLARRLQESSAVLSATLRSIGDGVLTVDRQGLITYINPAAERLTGLVLQDVRGTALSESVVLRDEANEGATVDLGRAFGRLHEETQLPGELVLGGTGTHGVPVDVALSPLRYGAENEIQGYVVTLRDVTSIRSMTRDLSRLALQDQLTGLLNRRGFALQLEQALHRKRNSAAACGLLFIDLDRFKAVNDHCGHQAGDRLLQEVVAVIRQCIRDTDVFARMGGDEFAILLPGCPIEKAAAIASGICRAVAEYRFEWEGRQWPVGASIGVVPVLEDDTQAGLLEAADKACYRAKAEGRGMARVDLRA